MSLPAVAGLGCKWTSTSGREKSDGGQYAVVRDRDGGETRVRLGPGPVPSQFPPGLPLYPGAEFSSTALTAKAVVLALETNDSADAALDFYRRQPGYAVTFDTEVDGMRVLNITHGASGRKFQVLVKASGRQTSVSLVAPR